MCVKLILWFFQIACYGHIELFWEILLEWRGWEPSKGEAGWGGGGGEGTTIYGLYRYVPL